MVFVLGSVVKGIGTSRCRSAGYRLGIWGLWASCFGWQGF